MLNEFKEFALKGNVLDMAVGIIIGAAFTTIVSSLVDDVLMPPIGVLLGGIDFGEHFIQLTMRDQTFLSVQSARDAGAAVIAYGNFLNAVIKFVIVAFALFILIKNINRVKQLMERQQAKEAEAAPAPRQEILLEEIRDAIKSRPAV